MLKSLVAPGVAVALLAAACGGAVEDARVSPSPTGGAELSPGPTTTQAAPAPADSPGGENATAPAPGEPAPEAPQEASDSARSDTRRLAAMQEEFHVETDRYASNMELLLSVVERDPRIHPDNELGTCSFEGDQSFVVAVRTPGTDVSWFLDSSGAYEPVQQDPGKCDLQFGG